MDPFGVLGVTASIISCIQLTGSLLKRVGPSNHSKTDLNKILTAISGFRGAYESLKLYFELNEEDEVRLSALQHLPQPLQDCKQALDVLQTRLDTVTFVGQHIVGAFWDEKLKKCLERLENAKKLFELALHADQQIRLNAIESYSRIAVEDLRDVKITINENGKRLLDLDEHTRDHDGQTKLWYTDVSNSVHAIDENVQEQEKVAKRRHTDIKTSLDESRQWRCETDQRTQDDNREKIFDWLSSTDPTGNHNSACKKHQPNTGNWFLHSDEYSQWKKTPGSFLWIHGIPGSGKTVLCSTIIQDTVDYCETQCTLSNASKPACSVAFFYCSFTDAEKQKTYNLICSLLVQLARRLPEIPDSLLQLYNQYKKVKPPIGNVKQTLRSILEFSEQSFLIIDALDECETGEEGRTEILASLADISEWAFPKLHVLVTSRKEPDIDEALTPLVTIKPICIQTTQVQKDIRSYVRSQLTEDSVLRKWSAATKENVEKTLVDGANGMFRWVFCQLESLKKCLKPKDVKNALKSLPKTLDATYDRILLSIEDIYHQEAITALQWLAFSKRPLTIEELAEAALINLQNDPPFDLEDRFTDPHNVLNILSSLVVVSIREGGLRTEEIRLAHFSVKEYLISYREKPAGISKFTVNASTADRNIAESCLLYIKNYADAGKKHPVKRDFEEFPLLRYAGIFWPRHLEAIRHMIDTSLSDSLFTFFASESAMSTWASVESSQLTAPFRLNSTTGGPLYHACDLGLYCLVERLLDAGAAVDAQGGLYGNALIVASRKCPEVVQLLLDKGADVNSHGMANRTPLQVTSEYGCTKTAELLLDRGADVNSHDKWDRTSLWKASACGHAEVTRLLLDRGADVNSHDKWNRISLWEASACGHTEVVKLLLDRGADVNSHNIWNRTSLWEASACGHTEVVKLLLDRGAS